MRLRLTWGRLAVRPFLVFVSACPTIALSCLQSHLMWRGGYDRRGVSGPDRVSLADVRSSTCRFHQSEEASKGQPTPAASGCLWHVIAPACPTILGPCMELDLSGLRLQLKWCLLAEGEQQRLPLPPAQWGAPVECLWQT